VCASAARQAQRADIVTMSVVGCEWVSECGQPSVAGLAACGECVRMKDVELKFERMGRKPTCEGAMSRVEKRRRMADDVIQTGRSSACEAVYYLNAAVMATDQSHQSFRSGSQVGCSCRSPRKVDFRGSMTAL
jgi:hypothetical protein